MVKIFHMFFWPADAHESERDGGSRQVGVACLKRGGGQKGSRAQLSVFKNFWARADNVPYPLAERRRWTCGTPFCDHSLESKGL
jgi:hypothetical protein